MNARSFNISVQGASHIKKNKECQDASSSYHNDNMAIAIVCDGHGGDDYMRSAIGSTQACNVALRNIKQFLETVDKDTFFSDPDGRLERLEASIINMWNQLIYAHLEQNPFTEEELRTVSSKAFNRYANNERIESAYGTTLIAVAMTKEYWFGIHIGDGKCVAVNPEGRFVQPIPWDPKCFLNETTSMCDSDALNNFRHFYSEKLPVAVFVGSDGIDDCFKSKEQLNNLYKTILYSFGTESFDDAKKELLDYLPRLSSKGSGDDMSIAAMLDMDLVPELEVVKGYDREKEKARIEENARKEAERIEAERKRVEEERARLQREKEEKNKPKKKPRFCTECGNKLIDESKFCGECGTKVIIIENNMVVGANSQILSVELDGKADMDEVFPEDKKQDCVDVSNNSDIQDASEKSEDISDNESTNNMLAEESLNQEEINELQDESKPLEDNLGELEKAEETPELEKSITEKIIGNDIDDISQTSMANDGIESNTVDTLDKEEVLPEKDSDDEVVDDFNS